MSQPSVLLLPGAFYFGAAPGRIMTLLGSCVSITLWHPQRHIGGMCHFMLPRRPAYDEFSARYGDDVLQLFRSAIDDAGAAASEFRARVYGGANVLAAYAEQRASFSIGDANLVAARLVLSALGLCIEAHDIGGSAGRRLSFDLDSGEVAVTHYPISARRHAAAKQVL